MAKTTIHHHCLTVTIIFRNGDDWGMVYYCLSAALAAFLLCHSFWFHVIISQQCKRIVCVFFFLTLTIIWLYIYNCWPLVEWDNLRSRSAWQCGRMGLGNWHGRTLFRDKNVTLSIPRSHHSVGSACCTESHTWLKGTSAGNPCFCFFLFDLYKPCRDTKEPSYYCLVLVKHESLQKNGLLWGWYFQITSPGFSESLVRASCFNI